MNNIIFGSDEFLQLLRRDSLDYEAVYPIVDAAIRPFVRRKVNGDADAREDLLQEIHIAVWQALPRFLENAEHYSVPQRKSWLYAIAGNKINDAFRKSTQLKSEQNELNETYSAPYSDPESLLFLADRSEQLERCVDTLLRTACATRSKPENKLAFLYNRVIMPLDLEHPRKGDNKAVQARLKGQPLGEIRKHLETDLSRTLGRDLPADIFVSLDKSLSGRESKLFDLSTHQIAAASYTICTALSANHSFQAERDALEFSIDSAYGSAKKPYSLMIHGRCHYFSLIIRKCPR